MASPQLEHGHTRLANTLLEALVAFPWSSSVQLRLVLHVARQSYGFHRKKANHASLKELAVTLKEPRASVGRALQILIRGEVLTRDEKGRLALQKDYEKWIGPVSSVGRQRPASVPLVRQPCAAPSSSEAVPLVGHDQGSGTVSPVGRSVSPVGRLLYKGTERKLERKNNNARGGNSGALAGDPLEGFPEWYAAYPEKKARGAAERAWRALKPSPELRAQLLAALIAQKAARAASVRAGEFVPRWAYPATWLNQQRWLDEHAAPVASAPGPGAVKAPAGKYAAVGERHEIA